jgi:hypothetical protein
LNREQSLILRREVPLQAFDPFIFGLAGANDCNLVESLGVSAMQQRFAELCRP